MQLQKSLRQALQQLTHLVEQLSDEQYNKPCSTLFRATIGQHVRHIIELFVCLQRGYADGMVNYEDRERNQRVEQDRRFAYKMLVNVYEEIDRPDKELILLANYDERSEDVMLIPTNYHRELLYNLEHTVHHMALIRVGVNEIAAIHLPDGFGVATSTLKYKKACAQ